MIRFGDAWDYFRHQLNAGSGARHVKPRRDGDGRRLRASAYGRSRATSTSLKSASTFSWSSLLARVMLAVLLASIAFVASSKVYINFAGDLPDANALAAARIDTDSLIYAADGQTQLADLHPPGYQHYNEPLSAMGTLLPEATIAIEDANFYHEPGIDLTGIARAAWIDWREHRPAQGASTITQQLVKLRLLTSEPSLTRKLKEAVLALQVERSFSKQQILEMYLNTVFYGNDAYGTAAASKIYFHTTTARLDLAQASMLAGIPRNPTYDNPFANWEAAKTRQREVLQAMVRTHMITQAQSDTAFAEDISPPNHMFRPSGQTLAPGFVDYIKHVLQANYGDAANTGGLQVLTTLNMGLQSVAERDLRRNLAQNGPSNGFSQEALTSIDPHTGAIVAMVGSMPGHPGSEYNFAAYVPRQPGSSMKVYTYTTGLATLKYTMVTPIADTPMMIPARYTGDKDYKPTNYDGSYHGTCQYQACLGNSYNIPALKVELSLGVPAVIQMARDMGAPPWTGRGHLSQQLPLDAYPISSTLGGVYETPLQMATGMSVLASGGVLHSPFAIQKITSSDGVEIYKANPPSNAKQVLDARVAFIMAQIMSDNQNRINAFGSTSQYLIQPNRKIAAKTGTTQDFRDGWTVGFTPALATAIWTGNANNDQMNYGFDAVLDAGPAFHDYMFDATNFLHEPGGDWFAEPAGLIDASVGGRPAWFLPGTSPDQPAPPLPSFVVTTNVGPGCTYVRRHLICSAPSPTPSNGND